MLCSLNHNATCLQKKRVASHLIVILYKYVVSVLAFNFQKNWNPIPNYFYIKYQLSEPFLHQGQVRSIKETTKKTSSFRL